MLKKTVTYTDYNGNSRTEDFYFNMSKGEVVKMELRENLTGGLKAKLEAVIASNDGRLIMDTFEEIIRISYGIKSADGREFKKSEDISDGFIGSEAYSQIFLGLVLDPDSASNFVQNVFPQDLDTVIKDHAGRPQPQDHLTAQPVTRVVETPKDEVNAPLPGSTPVYPQEYLAWLAQRDARADESPEV